MRARKILRKPPESETIRETLDLVAFRRSVIREYDRVAGKAPFSRSVDRRVTRRVVGSSVYLTVPRNERFALTFRERYAREILRTSFEVHLVGTVLFRTLGD